ncbi:MAG: pyridoxal 5'-phosphate synthase glutaminase subunit PdxT [Thermotogae bacterium]|jgi:5'-phosphate synthase pdxT subunit|nr:pyridoxal 5'-phosphate synthase glutaminase subunit PdxT [Thermotogota bacterium]MCL5031721.1 pyridoxal 5'-phosphate synthase glutaminase subunit PdxT [Thermotogota bacterium]
MKIGILGMQGDIEEHLAIMEKIGVDSIRVKSIKTLETVDGLIMPGGESTTMLKLLKLTGLFDVLKEKIEKGFPVYGTCAGLILLANEVEHPAQDSLDVLDLSVSRNGYGRQINSFHAEISIPAIGDKPFDAVFIRAPVITKVGKLDVLASYNHTPVFVSRKNIIASTFHPELSDDTRIHEFFLEMVKNATRN